MQLQKKRKMLKHTKRPGANLQQTLMQEHNSPRPEKQEMEHSPGAEWRNLQPEIHARVQKEGTERLPRDSE